MRLFKRLFRLFFLLLIIAVIVFFTMDYNKKLEVDKEWKISNVITNFDIELKTTNVNFIRGTDFMISTNNKKIKFEEMGNIIYIKEKSFLTYSKELFDLTVTIPEGMVPNEINIEAGAGKVVLSDVTLKDVEVELGAGSMIARNTIIDHEMSVEAGAGNVQMDNLVASNLDLEMGAGKVSFKGDVSNSMEVKGGVGKLIVNLDNNLQNYNITINKGLGSIAVNGSEVSRDYYSDLGRIPVTIEGGVGSIELNTKE